MSNDDLKLKGSFKKELWINALSFEERLSAVVQWYKRGALFRGSNLYIKWSKLFPFKDKDLFKKRLKSFGVNRSQFKQIVSGKVQYDLSSIDFGWLVELQNSFEYGENKAADAFFVGDALIALPAKYLVEQSVFLIKQQCNINGNSGVVSDLPTMINLFLPDLICRLSDLIEKTIAVEIRISKEQRPLAGETSQVRFENYMQRFNNPQNVLKLFLKYPVLARLLAITCRQWKDFFLEFMGRLENDYHDIAALCASKDGLGLLCQLHNSEGDLHNEGRKVLILEFSSGVKVVYKPRSVEVEAQFNLVLDWLNAALNEKFIYPAVLSKDGYGWVSFVEHREIHDIESASGYFERQGGLLALAYLLFADDLHNENYIANGSSPVIIDLECLFQPDLPYYRRSNQASTHSVFSTGLLPHPKITGLDSSGFFGVSGLEEKETLQIIVGRGTDEIRMEPMLIVSDTKTSLLYHKGKLINPLNYSDEHLIGFAKVYRAFKENADVLLKQGSIISRMSLTQTRVIFNTTRYYSALLDELSHPDYQKCALEKDCLLDVLWSGREHIESHRAVVSCERESLSVGNIPLFSGTPSSTNILYKLQSFKESATRPTDELVSLRLKGLSEESLSKLQADISTGFLAVKERGVQERLLSNG